MRVDVAESHELILSLAVASDDRRDVFGAAAPVLVERVRAFAPSPWMWTHLVSVAAESPAPRDVAAFVAHLERTPAIEVQRRLVGYYASWFRELTPTAVTDRALRGDAVAARELVRSSMPDDPSWQASLRARLGAGERRTKHELLEIVEQWGAEVFDRVTRPTLRLLRTAVRVRRRAADRSAPEALVGAFIGSEYVADPATSRVIVVPSLVLEEEIHEFDHARTLFLCVPVQHRVESRAIDGVAVLRALADERRLRIVEALASEPLSAQDLADRLALGLPTTLHHLAALRRVGLVARGGRRQAYVLRPEPLRQLRDRVGRLSRARTAR